jgi:VanZ family protein
MKNTAAMKYRAWPAEQAGIICWALLLIAMIITSIVPNNGLFPSETKYWDKIFHLTTNSIATMLPLIFITNRQRAVCLAALVPVLGFGLEYLQRGISGRTFSPEDLIANNGGVILGAVIGISYRIYRRFKRRGAGK